MNYRKIWSLACLLKGFFPLRTELPSWHAREGSRGNEGMGRRQPTTAVSPKQAEAFPNCLLPYSQPDTWSACGRLVVINPRSKIFFQSLRLLLFSFFSFFFFFLLFVNHCKLRDPVWSCNPMPCKNSPY